MSVFGFGKEFSQPVGEWMNIVLPRHKFTPMTQQKEEPPFLDPKPGQYLWASCAGDNYGRVIAVGVDGNGAPTIDIELKSVGDLISSEDDDEWPNPDLTQAEVPEGVKVILRNVQWRAGFVSDGISTIHCRTPGNGCYRCTKFFWLYDHDRSEPGGIAAMLE